MAFNKRGKQRRNSHRSKAMTIKLMPMMTPTPNANARNQPTIGGTLFAVLFMTFLTARGRRTSLLEPRSFVSVL